VKIKAFCGALLSTVVAANGVAWAQAELIDQNGVQGPVTVVTYKGKEALEFLPSLRNHLQQEADSNSVFSAAAKERLHSINADGLTALQATIITPLSTPLPTPTFPQNPSAGQIVITQSCYPSQGGTYAADDAWQWQTPPDGKAGTWVVLRANTWRVSICPYASVGM
jgi:hypothetical protein